MVVLLNLVLKSINKTDKIYNLIFDKNILIN